MTEHIVTSGVIGASISEDGERAVLQLSDAGGDGYIALTVPKAHLGAIIESLQALQDVFRTAGLLAPAPPGEGGKLVQTWRVGASNRAELARFTAIMFDAGLNGESIKLMPDLQALGMADAIQQKVLGSFSEDEKRQLLKAVEDARTGKDKLRTPLGLIGRV